MSNIYEFVKSEISALIGVCKSKLGYGVLTMVLEIILASIRASHPNWTLPSSEQILAAGAILIGVHSIQDALYAIVDIVGAWRQTKKA